MNTLHVATWLAGASAVVSFAVAVYTAWYASKNRRQVSVLVHHGFFVEQPHQYFYFMKVTNLSRNPTSRSPMSGLRPTHLCISCSQNVRCRRDFGPMRPGRLG